MKEPGHEEACSERGAVHQLWALNLCAVDGCSEDAIKLGLCSMHLERDRKVSAAVQAKIDDVSRRHPMTNGAKRVAKMALRLAEQADADWAVMRSLQDRANAHRDDIEIALDQIKTLLSELR